MFRVVYLPNQDNIVVDLIEAENDIIVGGDAELMEGYIHELPEVTADVKEYISKNSYTSFRLHKVEDEEVKLRTVEELKNKPFAEWKRDVKIMEHE